MAKISEMFPSKFLKASDFDDGDQLATISTVKQEAMGHDDDLEEKFVVYFRELRKGLILNKTNAIYTAKIYGDDTSGWVGRKLILFKDVVSMRGQSVDCVRVRKPTSSPQQSIPAAPEEIPI